MVTRSLDWISARSKSVAPWRNWHRSCQSERRMPSDPDAAARSERSFLIDDAARLLGVSRRTVYYRIREGRLLTIRARCGSQRVLLSSIDALMRARQEGRQEGRQERRQEAGTTTERGAADVVGCAGELAGGSETKALPL
jgi:excisionase family DNA binding protein